MADAGAMGKGWFGMEQMIQEILQQGIALGGSDLFLVPGSPLRLKKKGEMLALEGEKLTPRDSEEIMQQLFDLAGRSPGKLLEEGDDDFAFSLQGVGRFRCTAYRQRGSLAAVIHIVAFGLPDAEEMHIPPAVMELAKERSGMVLVCGPAGSGKSTTLACLVDSINRERSGHIVTLEDPIEYLHFHRGCLVSQREIGHDTGGYLEALRASLRQTPDVILLGGMWDWETMEAALTAAESGKLLLSSLHTVNVAETIQRIADAFPAQQRGLILARLSLLLKAVVCQQLLPAEGGGVEPAFEILRLSPEVQQCIRRGDVAGADMLLRSGQIPGTQSMDSHILRLFQEKRISRETALAYAAHPDAMVQNID